MKVLAGRTWGPGFALDEPLLFEALKVPLKVAALQTRNHLDEPSLIEAIFLRDMHQYL